MQNLVVYNFKVPSDSQTDKLTFQELCSAVLNMNISLTKTICLGKKKRRQANTLAYLTSKLPTFLSTRLPSENSAEQSQRALLTRYNIPELVQHDLCKFHDTSRYCITSRYYYHISMHVVQSYIYST